jgi:stage III sporulation protein AF
MATAVLDVWVRQLAAVVLLAGMVETLLPPGGLRGYARALLSLLVLLVVLQPVTAVLSGRWQMAPIVATHAAVPAVPLPATATAYERLLTQGVQRLVAGVPGVWSAAVRLQFGGGGAGGFPAIEAAWVSVAANAQAPSASALTARVRAAVASGLDLPAGRVQVVVG